MIRPAESYSSLDIVFLKLILLSKLLLCVPSLIALVPINMPIEVSLTIPPFSGYIGANELLVLVILLALLSRLKPILTNEFFLLIFPDSAVKKKSDSGALSSLEIEGSLEIAIALELILVLFCIIFKVYN